MRNYSYPFIFFILFCQLFFNAILAQGTPSDDINIGKDSSHVDNQRAQIDPARTDKKTLATEHTVFQLVVEAVVLSTLEGGMYPADIEVGEAPRRAGGGTAATTDAPLVRRYQLKKLVDILVLDFVIVDLAALRYGETKFIQY